MATPNIVSANKPQQLPIKIGVFSGDRGRCVLWSKQLSAISEIDVVLIGDDLKSHLRGIKDKKPDVLLIDSDSPNSFPEELRKALPRILRKLKSESRAGDSETSILLRTNADFDNPFIKEMYAIGINIVSMACGPNEVSALMRRINTGEHLAFYPRKESERDLGMPPRGGNERM